MKSICNLIVFGSTLGALAALLVGCGDDDSGGGASCAQVCAKITAAKCDNDPDCISTCNDAKDSTPMGCTDVYNALARCYASAKFTCDGQQQSEAKECSKQEKAYAACVASGGKDHGDKGAGSGGSHAGESGSDAGGTNGGGGDGQVGLEDADGGGGANGSGGNTCNGEMLGPCAQCIARSCCDEVVACQNDCRALESCAANCSDSSCIQGCADAASASAVDLYNMVINCATDNCASECMTGTT